MVTGVSAGSSSGTANYVPKEAIGWKYFKGTANPSADATGKTWWQDADYAEDAGWLGGTAAIGYGETFINTELGDMSNNYSTIFMRKTFTAANVDQISSLVFQAKFDDGVKVWINGTPIYNFLSPGNTNTPSDHISLATASRSEAEGAVYSSVTLSNPAPSSYLVNGLNVISVQVFNRSTGSGDCYFDCELSQSEIGSTGNFSPSPLAQNNSFSFAAPPQVSGLSASPENPTTGENVNISISVEDPQGVQSVALAYQIVTPGNYIRRTDAAYEDPANWTQVSMQNNGLDAIYTGTIPGSAQVHRQLVRYRITVSDVAGHSVTLPYSDDTQPNFAYFTYDGLPSWTGKKSPSEPDVTYSANELGRMPVYHLIAQGNDIDNSQYNSGSDDQYFEGTMIYEGKVFDHMRFRNKGSGSTYRTGHNKWKLNFNKGHRFLAKDYYGQEMKAEWDKFSIQTSESPWWRNDVYPMSGMLFQESLMTKLNNLAGANAPEMLHFHFRVIDDANESSADQHAGDFWGIYTAQQHPDKSYFEQNDLPKSNLYKLNGPNAATASKWYHNGEQVENNSDLASFISGYKTANNAAWWEANLELPVYYSWNALNLSINNSDLRKEQNVIYWNNSETGKWHPCIWDVDLLFEDAQHLNRDPYAAWEDLNRVFAYSQYYIDGQNRARELQDLLYRNGQYDRVIDEFVTQLTGNVSGNTANTLVDANQAMWNYHPRKIVKGNWYRIENNTFWSDFADMASYMKAFPKVGGFGGTQLESKMQVDADTAVPDKPAISYTGVTGYPTNKLNFQSSGFSDSTGSVEAIEWRVGEIYDPNVSGYIAGTRWKYEISAVWESGELAWDGNITSVDIPVSAIEIGKTYRARVRHKDNTGRWSRWSDAHEFQSSAADISSYRNGLVVTELHYNPLDPSTPAELSATLDGTDFEFIELRNVGNTSLDLSGINIADGVTFDFTGSMVTSLAPNQATLVVKNIAAFTARYGAIQNIAGEFDGKLSNKGEYLRISYGDGNTPENLVREFTYDDKSPWPEEADGDGPSMVLKNPWILPDHDQASSWRASGIDGGEPSAIDSWNYDQWLINKGIDPTQAGGDADNDGISNREEYFFGGDPNDGTSSSYTTASVENLSVDSVAADYLVITFSRNLKADDLTHIVEQSSDLNIWGIANLPQLIDSTSLGNNMEKLRYRSARTVDSVTNVTNVLRLKITEIAE